MSSISLSWRAYGRQPALWLGLLCLCLAALFVPIGAIDLSKAMRLSSEGIETRASVVDHQIHTSRGSNGRTRTSYSLTLRFADQQGVPQTTHLPVSEETYQRLGIGSQTALRYVPADPSITEVEPGAKRRDGLIMAGVGALSGVGALAFLVWFLRATAAQRRALARGERRQARIVAHHKVGKAHAKTYSAEWNDGQVSGRSRTLKEAALPPLGSAITVVIDPVSGKGWWDADL